MERWTSSLEWSSGSSWVFDLWKSLLLTSDLSEVEDWTEFNVFSLVSSSYASSCD
jgi:hypothetical protein